MSILPQNGGLGLFSIDANATPDQIAKKRALIAAMMPQFGKARYVGEGIGQLATGIATGMANRKMDKFEADKRSEASEAYRNLVGGGPLSVLGMKDDWGTTFAAEPEAADPMSPEAIGRDAMAALGKTPQGGHDHDSHAGQSHADWLRYSNQSATRNKPLDPKLVSALSFLPEMGITMDVVSGGQDGKGQGDRRTGSTRHDHGGAADADFYMGDRKLDWNNPSDIPVFQELVRRARSNGVTGFGAGDDYMGAGRMHIGFGNPGVWGAGGSGANAPDWLREAYSGAPSAGGGSSRVGTGPQVAYNGPSVAELFSALSNPWLSQEERGVVGMMLQQAQQANDPMRAMEMERAQLELDQLRNPQVKPININGKLVDPNTYEVIADFSEGPDPTSAMQEYDLARSQGYEGTFADYKRDMAAAGRSSTTVNVGDGNNPGLGKLSTDFGYVLDPATGKPVIDPQTGLPKAAPVPGSPAAREIEAASEKKSLTSEGTSRSANVVMQDIDLALKQSEGFGTTGFFGGLFDDVGGTAAHDLQNTLRTVQANIGFDRLQQMREASPTGGALGGVSERELTELQAVLGSVQQSQGKAQLQRNLNRLKALYSDILRKAEAYPNAADFGFGGSQQQGEMSDADYLKSLGLE